MAKKGTGLLMVWADVPADKEDEFNRWYNEEHLPERMAIPGFLSGARYEAVKGGPKHLAYYELESAAVLRDPGLQEGPGQSHRVDEAVRAGDHRHDVHPERLHDDPSPGAHARRSRAPRWRRCSRSAAWTCRPPPIAEFNTWYNTVYVPNYEKVPGVIRGRRYRAVEGTPTYLTLYEFEHPKVSESPAWMAQRDASPANAKMRNT